MGATAAARASGRRVAAAAALAGALGLATAGAALAQGSIKVRLPDLSGLSRAESKALLQALARVNVITSHCPGWDISPGEWMLLTATGDKLAARLGLDPAVYDRQYFGRAFALLDDPRNCDRVGPEARPLLRRLVAMGGSTEAIASGGARANAFQGKAKGKGQRGPADGKGHGSGNGGKGNNGNGHGNSGGNGHGNPGNGR